MTILNDLTIINKKSFVIMIHLCFIIDNSLTMDQRPNSGISLLDSVKSSIQNTLRNLYRLGFPNNHEHIHLFCTSNPQSYLSSFQHDEAHLYCQLKSITSSIHTNPSLTIQTALEQISKFRILSQAETFKGYRQAFIYEPALIIFLSDRMTKKKIMSIVNSIDQGKFSMRSQYQFAAYLVGIPSYTERNLLTEEVFKSTLEGQKEIKMYGEALRRMNSELKFIMNYDNMNNFLWNRIETFEPFLLFHFELKEIKKKFNEFVPSERGTAYFKAWEQYLSNIPFQLVPSKLFKIPMPFNISKCRSILELSDDENQRKIETISKLKFYLDLTKKYVDVNSNILPENKYKILSNPAISILENENLQEKYPIFFEYKGMQCPIGLFCVSSRGTQVNLYFANFSMLNNILKCVEAKQPFKAIESNVYAYLNSIPHFYVKFLRNIFDKLNFSIDYDIFENPQPNNVNLTVQTKLENIRIVEKRNLPKIFQANLENHQKFRADCCPTYSSAYSISSQIKSKQNESYTNLQHYFNDLVGDLLSFKKKVGIEDYLTSNQIESGPMVKELQKYNNVKKIGDDDFNENITINFGNPYRKKRKTNDSEMGPRDFIITKQSVESPQRYSEPSTPERQVEKEPTTPISSMSEERYQSDREKDKFNDEETVIRKEPAATKESRSIIVEQERANKRQEQRQPKKIQEEAPIINDETVNRLNSMPVSKSIDMHFNQKNLVTEQMLKNETIIHRFFENWRRR